MSGNQKPQQRGKLPSGKIGATTRRDSNSSSDPINNSTKKARVEEQEIQSDETNSNARPKQKKRVHWPDDMELIQCFVYDPNIWEIDEEKKELSFGFTHSRPTSSRALTNNNSDTHNQSTSMTFEERKRKEAQDERNKLQQMRKNGQKITDAEDQLQASLLKGILRQPECVSVNYNFWHLVEVDVPPDFFPENPNFEPGMDSQAKQLEFERQSRTRRPLNLPTELIPLSRAEERAQWEESQQAAPCQIPLEPVRQEEAQEENKENVPEPMDDDEIADDRTEFELVPQPNEADDDERADNEHPNDAGEDEAITGYADIRGTIPVQGSSHSHFRGGGEAGGSGQRNYAIGRTHGPSTDRYKHYQLDGRPSCSTAPRDRAAELEQQEKAIVSQIAAILAPFGIKSTPVKKSGRAYEEVFEQIEKIIAERERNKDKVQQHHSEEEEREAFSPPTNVNLPPPTSEEPPPMQINEDEAQQSDEHPESEPIQIDEVEEQEQPAEQQKESEPPIEIDDLFETSDEQQVVDADDDEEQEPVNLYKVLRKNDDNKKKEELAEAERLRQELAMMMGTEPAEPVDVPENREPPAVNVPETRQSDVDNTVADMDIEDDEDTDLREAPPRQMPTTREEPQMAPEQQAQMPKTREEPQMAPPANPNLVVVDDHGDYGDFVVPGTNQSLTEFLHNFNLLPNTSNANAATTSAVRPVQVDSIQEIVLSSSSDSAEIQHLPVNANDRESRPADKQKQSKSRKKKQKPQQQSRSSRPPWSPSQSRSRSPPSSSNRQPRAKSPSAYQPDTPMKGICKFFSARRPNASCKAKERCLFYHDRSHPTRWLEIQEIGRDNDDPNVAPLMNCEFHFARGPCFKGEDCSYSHGNVPTRGSRLHEQSLFASSSSFTSTFTSTQAMASSDSRPKSPQPVPPPAPANIPPPPQPPKPLNYNRASTVSLDSTDGSIIIENDRLVRNLSPARTASPIQTTSRHHPNSGEMPLFGLGRPRRDSPPRRSLSRGAIYRSRSRGGRRSRSRSPDIRRSRSRTGRRSRSRSPGNRLHRPRSRGGRRSPPRSPVRRRSRSRAGRRSPTSDVRLHRSHSRSPSPGASRSQSRAGRRSRSRSRPAASLIVISTPPPQEFSQAELDNWDGRVETQEQLPLGYVPVTTPHLQPLIKDCPHYARFKQCDWGANCKFSHGDLNPTRGYRMAQLRYWKQARQQPDQEARPAAAQPSRSRSRSRAL